MQEVTLPLATTAAELVADKPTGRDIRVERLNEIYELVRAYPLAHPKTFENLGIDVDDFVQDVVTNIFRRKGLDNYDESKINDGIEGAKKFQALIFNICYRQVIDIQRAKFERKSRLDPETGLPYQVVSLDEELSNHDGDLYNRHELTASEPEMRTLIIELMDGIPDTQISPNYKMSWRELFLWSYEKSVDEIADEVGISPSRVAQLQLQMGRDYLQKARRSGEVPKKSLSPIELYRDYILAKSAMALNPA